jgi:hypothetical protein
MPNKNIVIGLLIILSVGGILTIWLIRQFRLPGCPDVFVVIGNSKEECIKAAKHLEERYKGCEYQHFCETLEESIRPEPIDTSNWKTYRNEKYGFEVRYPKDYDKVEECKLKETDNGIEIGEGRLSIEVEVLKYEHPLENYVQKFVAEKMKEYGILGRSLDELAEENLWIPVEKILVGSNEGFRVSLPVKPSNIIFLSNGNKFYKIIWTSIGVTSCLGYNGIEGYDEFQIFEQIPFTFRIIK